MIYDLVRNTGFDSFCFVIEKTRALKLLKKLEINNDLRLISRNKTISEYAKLKFGSELNDLSGSIKHPYRVRYINFKKRGKSLSNTLIMVENSLFLNELCRTRKKAYGSFVMITFAGLYQPSREILPKTHKILKAFLDRFNVYSYDIAKDFKTDKTINSSQKANFKEALGSLCEGEIYAYKTTLYANKCKGSVAKVLVYDKFAKERFYHKQRLSDSLKNWCRCEMRVIARKRFSKITKDELERHCERLDIVVSRFDSEMIFGVREDFLNAQMRFFADMRHKLGGGFVLREFVA